MTFSARLIVLKYLAFFAGCYACYFLQVVLKQPPVFSAAAVGFAGSFLHFPKFYEKKGLHSALFAGSLAGMCSRQILTHPIDVVWISFFGAMIYVLALPHANGMGGRLGTIAFISSLLFFASRTVW